MFGIGWSEFVVIGVVALIAIGPKELPGVLRAVGHWVGKIKRMANEFQGQFQEALREAEMADVRKELEEISASATDIKFDDPVAEANREIASSFDDKPVTEAAPTEPVATAELPQIDVPAPEPLPPVTGADFAATPDTHQAAPPADVPAGDLLPPAPEVPTKVASGGGT